MWKNGNNYTDFNPHPRVEGDLDSYVASSGSTHFNPHPRVEGDGVTPLPTWGRNNFNPHPRVEGDQMANGNLYEDSGFQSTPSRGG